MELDIGYVFDLDGTLVDSVYQHVLAWKEALDTEGIDLSVWRIHRKIGMSGGLFTNMLLRETNREISPEVIYRLGRHHAAAYTRLAPTVKALPGARALLDYLDSIGVRWAIATSAAMETARFNLDILGLDPSRITVVTRDEVRYAKPNPDLFLAAAHKLGLDIQHAVIVGDAVWDMLAARRARGLGIGLLSGGYGRDELERSGAVRVFDDPADLLYRIDEIGGRR